MWGTKALLTIRNHWARTAAEIVSELVGLRIWLREGETQELIGY